MAEGERAQCWQGSKSTLREELEAVLVQVDSGGFAGELPGEVAQVGAVAQNRAALLLSA